MPKAHPNSYAFSLSVANFHLSSLYNFKRLIQSLVRAYSTWDQFSPFPLLLRTNL